MIHTQPSTPPAAQARARLRRHVQRHLDSLEVLIQVLDLEDGDADREPSLGSPEYVSHLWGLPRATADLVYPWSKGSTDDREGDGDRGGSSGDSDLEPSLGAPASVSQLQWGKLYVDGPSTDLELEHDGREPQCEDEGAQCDDEGAPEYEMVSDYVDSTDQTSAASCGFGFIVPGGIAVSPGDRVREIARHQAEKAVLR